VTHLSDRGSYMQDPQKGNLANYGKPPQMRDPAADKAPQTYVRLMVELSYDTPRPDPDGALRRECGAAIRRAVEGRLTGEALAAQLGDATVELRAMVMRQESNLEAFGAPTSVTVHPSTETRVVVGNGYRLDDDGVVRPAGAKLPPQIDKEARHDALEYGEHDDEEDLPPNAGSAS
jgi:hypothetical protein